jgi:beta-mannanase
VNGDWFPWNGRWNGAGRTDGYANPDLPDGPERFRDAYRHIVDICRNKGGNNLTWFFHVDVGAWPKQPWNTRFANYYPGDAYVDWIGISDY